MRLYAFVVNLGCTLLTLVRYSLGWLASLGVGRITRLQRLTSIRLYKAVRYELRRLEQAHKIFGEKDVVGSVKE